MDRLCGGMERAAVMGRSGGKAAFYREVRNKPQWKATPGGSREARVWIGRQMARTVEQLFLMLSRWKLPNRPAPWVFQFCLEPSSVCLGCFAKGRSSTGFTLLPGPGLQSGAGWMRLIIIPMLSELSRILVLLDHKIIGEKKHRLISFGETCVLFCKLPENRSGRGFQLLARGPAERAWVMAIERWKLKLWSY